MRVIIGSARIDENGNIAGGKAGDQTGKEVSVQDFYVHKKGWLILRPKSGDDAVNIAVAMLEACDNNKIGYDQNQRTGIITCLKKYGRIAKIAEPTEADCSSTIRACCIQAGFDPGQFNTANEVSVLKATGRFEPAITYTPSTVLHVGDILVTATKGHTAVVVNGANRTTAVPIKQEKRNPYTEPTRIIKKGCHGDDVKWVQWWLNENGAFLTVDGDAGSKTDAAIRAFQKLNGLEIDGEVGPLTRNKLKNSK